jgi:hypothetical protein
MCQKGSFDHSKPEKIFEKYINRIKKRDTSAEKKSDRKRSLSGEGPRRNISSRYLGFLKPTKSI